MARPTKLTAEVHNAICEAMRKGHYLESAAALVGVAPKTVREWCARGEDEPDSDYGKFRAAYEKACAEAVNRALGVIEDASATQWQAAAWFLERRQPVQWGRRDPDSALLKELKTRLDEVKKLPDDEVKKLLGEG